MFDYLAKVTNFAYQTNNHFRYQTPSISHIGHTKQFEKIHK